MRHQGAAGGPDLLRYPRPGDAGVTVRPPPPRPAGTPYVRRCPGFLCAAAQVDVLVEKQNQNSTMFLSGGFLFLIIEDLFKCSFKMRKNPTCSSSFIKNQLIIDHRIKLLYCTTQSKYCNALMHFVLGIFL